MFSIRAWLLLVALLPPLALGWTPAARARGRSVTRLLEQPLGPEERQRRAIRERAARADSEAREFDDGFDTSARPRQPSRFKDLMAKAAQKSAQEEQLEWMREAFGEQKLAFDPDEDPPSDK